MTKRLHTKGFDIFGPKRGPLPEPESSSASSANKEPAFNPLASWTNPTCTKCHDTGIADTGYHGPPGDDRGSMPCPACHKDAFDTFFLGGDHVYGISIEEAFDLIRQVEGT